MRSFTRKVVVVCIALTGAFVVTAARADDGQEPAAQSPATSAPSPSPAERPQHKSDGDDHPAPNSVYAEGLGAGILYSINYERMVSDEVGLRVGFSYTSIGASTTSQGATTSASATFITVPVTVSYVGIRSGKSSLELGGGATIAYASGSASGVGASASGSGMLPYGVALVGYRLHPVDHAGFQFRIGVMALVGEGLAFSNANPSAVGILPWGYLSLGASF